MATLASAQPTPESVRDRAIRLFTFLRELAEIRTKAIRTIDQYESVLWLGEIPREEGCYCAAWDLGGEREIDAWVQIKRPRLPAPPDPPESVRPWISTDEMTNSREIPKLRQVLAVHIEGTGNDEVQTEYRRLSDHPEIVRAWNIFVREEWQAWADTDKVLRSVLSFYTELFSVYQRQQRLGEAYEVVLGLGCLSWHSRSGHLIQRHLVTAQTMERNAIVTLTAFLFKKLHPKCNRLTLSTNGSPGGIRSLTFLLETEVNCSP